MYYEVYCISIDHAQQSYLGWKKAFFGDLFIVMFSESYFMFCISVKVRIPSCVF